MMLADFWCYQKVLLIMFQRRCKCTGVTNYKQSIMAITRILPQLWIIFFIETSCLIRHTSQATEILSQITSKSLSEDENEQELRIADDLVMNSDQIENAVKYGFESLDQLLTVKEPIWYKMGLYLEASHPASRVANFGKPNKRALELSKFGFATVEASRKIAESFPVNASRQFSDFSNAIKSRMIEESCPLRDKPRCPLASKRYRTADGTCNNLSKPWKGSSMLPFERFLPPIYEDGVQSIRRSVLGGPLPSPRQISVRIHREKNQETQDVSLMFMQWGQFIDHDVTSVVKSRSFNGSIPRCCDGRGRSTLPPELSHPSCLPIDIPEDDWFFGKFGLRCMEFLRSAPSTRIDCDLGWREQINQVTPFIDASMIYGSDIETSDSIRTFRNGKIIYGRPRPHVDGEPLLPPDPPDGELCRAGALTTECLQPGDGRVGEQPGLIALHTVWVRYHNKVATVLARHNPHWSDEKVYQETRKIVYALIQFITYREFLPVLLGPEVVKLFELDLVTRGYYNGYDKRVNPAIANAFSSAAYRFGHSMVQNSYVRTDHKHRPIFNNVTLHDEMTNFENIWSLGSVDRLLLGLCDHPAQRRDEFVCDELSNHLFQPPGLPFGVDLTAVNLQRGRDHGLPPYTAWREPCGLKTVRSWRDLERVFGAPAVQRLRRVYRHVDDVDLFSGGLAERPMRGAVVGPTFACIVAQQFLNLRKGDRFWFENGKFQSSFTPAQLQQIRKVSFSSILCETMDEIETIQKYVFLAADEVKNKRISCDSSSMKHLDLLPWVETSSNGISNTLDFGFGREGIDILEDIDLSPLESRRRTQIKHKKRNKFTSTTVRTTTSKSITQKSKSGSKNIVIVKDANKHQKVSSSQPNNPLEVNIKIQYFLPPSSTTTPAPIQRKKKRPTVTNYNNKPSWATNSDHSYPVYVQSSSQVGFSDQSYGTVSNSNPSYIYNRPSFLDDYGSSGSKPDKIINRPVQNYRPIQVLSKPLQEDYNRPMLVYSRPINVDRYEPENGYRPAEIYSRPTADSYGDNNNHDKYRPRPGGFAHNNGYDQYDEVNLEGEPLFISVHDQGNYRPSNQQHHYIYNAAQSSSPNNNYFDEIPNYYYAQNKPAGAYDRIDGVEVNSIPKRPTFGHTSSSGGISHKTYSIGHVQKVENDEINDKLDFKTRLVTKRKHAENDDGFVKISSVKAHAILSSSHSFSDTVSQREGDAEIDVNKDEDNEERIRLVEVSVAPDEINENNWLVYNETEETVPPVSLPEYDQQVSSTDEVPRQIKTFRTINRNKSVS